MIPWLDSTQPCDVRRQRLTLARQRGKEWHKRRQAVQPWILLTIVIVGWLYIVDSMWKGLMR